MAFIRERSGGKFGGRGGGGGFGGSRGGFGGGDRRPEMHQATCSECGNRCEVPFRPTGDKPVYCSDCFKNVEKPAGGRDSGRREFGGRDRGDRGRSDFGEKRMHKAVCAECGANCEVPFKPMGGKPVLCSNCFGGKNEAPRSKGGADKSAKEFEMINSKLDQILKALGATSVKKEKIEKAPVEEEVEKKEVKKKAEKKTTAKKAVKAKKKAK